MHDVNAHTARGPVAFELLLGETLSASVRFLTGDVMPKLSVKKWFARFVVPLITAPDQFCLGSSLPETNPQLYKIITSTKDIV